MCDSGGCSRPGAPAPAVSQEIQDITGLLNKGECFVLNEVSEEGRGQGGSSTGMYGLFMTSCMKMPSGPALPLVEPVRG